MQAPDKHPFFILRCRHWRVSHVARQQADTDLLLVVFGTIVAYPPSKTRLAGAITLRPERLTVQQARMPENSPAPSPPAPVQPA